MYYEKYENGASTKQLILDVCKELFLENGFQETSYDDICKKAHVNRGTIYYHLKDKENIRFLVHEEYIARYVKLGERYCDIPEYWYHMGMTILWHQFLNNHKLRRFLMEFAKDNLIYAPEKAAVPAFVQCYQRFSDRELKLEDLEELSISAAYGLLMYMIQVAGQQWQVLTAEDLVRRCMINIGKLYHLEDHVVKKTWEDMCPYIQKLPWNELLEINVWDVRK